MFYTSNNKFAATINATNDIMVVIIIVLIIMVIEGQSARTGPPTEGEPEDARDRLARGVRGALRAQAEIAGLHLTSIRHHDPTACPRGANAVVQHIAMSHSVPCVKQKSYSTFQQRKIHDIKKLHEACVFRAGDLLRWLMSGPTKSSLRVKSMYFPMAP